LILHRVVAINSGDSVNHSDLTFRPQASIAEGGNWISLDHRGSIRGVFYGSKTANNSHWTYIGIGCRVLFEKHNFATSA